MAGSGGGVFSGRTAWFSESVNREYIKLWYRHGGSLEDVDKPDFIFSEDASSEDTERIYNSPAYLKDSLAVIHPMYVECCVQAHSMKEVTLGHFFLPPQDIYEAIKHNHQFRWEQIERQTSAKKNIGKQIWKSASKKPQESTHLSTKANPAMRDLSNALSESGDQVDVGKKRPRSPERSHSYKRKRQSHRRVIPDYSDYLRVEDLPKVNAELFDFKPGLNGCTIGWADDQ